MSEIQQREGHGVTVFTVLGDASPGGEERVDVRQVPGGRLIDMLRRETLISLAAAVMLGAAVIRGHRRRPYDVLHLHGDFVDALLGALLGQVLRVPAVITVHAGLNKALYYQVIARCAWRWIDGIIAHSEEIRDELVALGADPTRITVSHTAIWYEHFARPGERRAGPASGDVMRIVSVGRLDPMKGFEHLIDAAAMLPPDPPARVLIAGDGPERPFLERRAASVPAVELLGQVSHPQVPELLGRADIYAQPSVSLRGQREATTVTVQEAMAAGLPVVTTSVGGIKQLVTDGVNGYVVPERDPRAMADAITRLARDPELRERMGKHNREQARGYDWTFVAAQVAEAYARAARVR